MPYFLQLFSLGTSAAQTVAAADKVEEGPSTVPASICEPGPKTMQQDIDKGAVTSGRGKGKMSGKRMIQNPMLNLMYKYTVIIVSGHNHYCELFKSPVSSE